MSTTDTTAPAPPVTMTMTPAEVLAELDAVADRRGELTSRPGETASAQADLHRERAALHLREADAWAALAPAEVNDLAVRLLLLRGSVHARVYALRQARTWDQHAELAEARTA